MRLFVAVRRNEVADRERHVFEGLIGANWVLLLFGVLKATTKLIFDVEIEVDFCIDLAANPVEIYADVLDIACRCV